MPLLLLLGSFFTWVAGWLGKEFAIRLMIVAAFVAATGTMVAAISAAASGVSMVMPPELTVAASWIVWPGAAEQISIYLGARFIRWYYDNNIWLLRIKG